ncbi:MAG: AraC family transcriptional regulator [Cyanobacteria bacterium P01_A01_bin.123]
MSLTLNQSDWNELCEQAEITNVADHIDEFEILSGVPVALGQGYARDITLAPGIELSFSEYQFHQDFRRSVSDHDHPIQIGIFPVGTMECNIHPVLGGTHGYFSGSGISPGYTETFRTGQLLSCVNIEIQPEVLESTFLTEQQRHQEPIQQLFKQEAWKVSFYPKVTSQMRSLAHQMWHAPYRGAAKQLYLQAKVFELLALHLDLLTVESPSFASSLRPDTLARIYYAQEILIAQLENPPSLLELAQRVGVSDRTLRRGFKKLYGTTVIGYLKQQRMERAKQLLHDGEWTVTEVARTVGYGHLGHFAAAFKHQFGMTPKQCLSGKLSS